jgi:undecaprenyl-diphosphatase
MSILQAVLLGIIQGATEFIPVSSSGHLVLVPALLGWAPPGLAYDAFLHLATLIAVIAYFWRDIVDLVVAWCHSWGHLTAMAPRERMAWLLIVSAIPGAILGYFLNDAVSAKFESPRFAGIMLLVTGLLLVGSEQVGRRVRDLDHLKLSDALWMGLAQGLAIAPGLSRSGATVSAGLLCGLRRDEAARFSFLMGIPIILGAGGMQVLKLTQGDLQSLGLGVFVAGFVAAAVAGYLAIRVLLNYVRSHSLRPFAYYCFVIGAAAIVLTTWQ